MKQKYRNSYRKSIARKLQECEDKMRELATKHNSLLEKAKKEQEKQDSPILTVECVNSACGFAIGPVEAKRYYTNDRWRCGKCESRVLTRQDAANLREIRMMGIIVDL